jgi:hypothetical protein
MQSILQARKRFYDNTEIWWSVKPKEYEQLKDMDVYYQIAGQVYYTDKSIEKQLHKLGDDRKLIVEYEDFCLKPKAVADAIKQRYFELGFELHMNVDMIDSLEARNKNRLAAKDIQKLENAYSYFESLPESTIG